MRRLIYSANLSCTTQGCFRDHVSRTETGAQAGQIMTEQTHDSPGATKVKSSLELYLETHGIPISTAKNLAWSLGSVLLICLVVIFMLWRRSHAASVDEDASRDLFSNRPQTQASLDTLMERCSSSKLAPLIMLKQAHVQYSEQNFDLATTTYERFLKQYPGHELAIVAELGQTFCKEARRTKDDLEAALQGFTEFRKKHPGSFLDAEAVFGRARCMEQLGRLEEARQVYEDFKVANPTENVWQERADANLKVVESELRRSKKTP